MLEVEPTGQCGSTATGRCKPEDCRLFADSLYQKLLILTNICWSYLKTPFKPTGEKNLKPSFSLGPHLIHQYLVHLTHYPQRQLDRFTHFRTITPQIPHSLQWDALYSPLKLPLPVGQSPPPSTCLVVGPCWSNIPNGIQIPLAVFHNPPDKQRDQQNSPGDKTCTNTRLRSRYQW